MIERGTNTKVNVEESDSAIDHSPEPISADSAMGNSSPEEDLDVRPDDFASSSKEGEEPIERDPHRPAVRNLEIRCSAAQWIAAQDADSVIRRVKYLLRCFPNEPPSKERLREEQDAVSPLSPVSPVSLAHLWVLFGVI